MKELLQFTEAGRLFDRFSPVTPYGKAFKASIALINDRKKLEKEYDDLELFCRFVRGKPKVASRICAHLKQVPWIDDLLGRDLDAADIFLIKRFLIHFSEALKLLPKKLCRVASADFKSGSLLKLLSPSNSDETFAIEDRYSKDLAEVRVKLRRIDTLIMRLRGTQLKKLLDRYGLDLRFRDFIVYPEEKAKIFRSEPSIYVEPMDSRNVILRPVLSDEHLEQLLMRDKLVAREKELEAGVIKDISAKIRQQNQLIKGYTAAVERMDVLLTKASLTLEMKMTRPAFMKTGSCIKISGGVYTPLKETLRGMGLDYEPLNVGFRSRIGVIHGSNMGGKTVVLRTIGFMQLLAQMGFFVPASRFQTVIFDRIEFIGGEYTTGLSGLSSFGVEMHRFIDAYSDRRSKTLYLLDEFAKTTNSNEATALIAGILKGFSKNANIYGLFSTHFVDLPKMKDITFYRMKGLDAGAYTKYYRAGKDYSLGDRLKLINRFMRYEVLLDDGRTKIFDALKVARIIGMDEDIILNAVKFMEERNVR